MGPLFSLAAHELRTPVSVVAGYLRMLQQDAATLDPRHRRIVDEAVKSCERLTALIAELSDIGKLDSGLVPPGQERFDVLPTVAEAVDAARGAPHDHVQVSVTGDRAGAFITGDRLRLRTALTTIVRAVLREDTSGTVVVDCRTIVPPGPASTDRVVQVVVASGSEAATAASAPRALLDEGRGGLGLGVPIARRVIDIHGGTVWSPASTQGTAIRGAIVIALPCRPDGG